MFGACQARLNPSSPACSLYNHGQVTLHQSVSWPIKQDNISLTSQSCSKDQLMQQTASSRIEEKVAISINDEIILHFKTAAKSQRMSSIEFEYGFKFTFCASSPFFQRVIKFSTCAVLYHQQACRYEPVNTAHSEMHENGTLVSH